MGPQPKPGTRRKLRPTAVVPGATGFAGSGMEPGWSRQLVEVEVTVIVAVGVAVDVMVEVGVNDGVSVSVQVSVGVDVLENVGV